MKHLDCPLPYGFHHCKGPMLTVHGVPGQQCKFCAVRSKATHKCPAMGLTSYTYDLSLDILHCDASVRAAKAAHMAAEAAAQAVGEASETAAAAAQAAAAVATATAAAADRYVPPDDLDLPSIIASLQMRRYGGRHVVVSKYTTDYGVSQDATVTVYLTPSDMFVGDRFLTGMKVLQPDDEELPPGFVILMYSGVPGGPPANHELTRHISRWMDVKAVLFQPLGLAILHSGGDNLDLYVDPRWIGNLGVTLNHSCSPNVDAEDMAVTVMGRVFTVLQLLSTVRGADTELRWDYRSICDKESEVIPCACGCKTDLCRLKTREEVVREQREAKKARFDVRPPHSRESGRLRARMMQTGRLAEEVAIRELGCR